MASPDKSAGSEGHNPAQEKVDPSLASQFQRRNNSNLATIKDKLNNNLELQLMVLSTISDYETASRVSKAGTVGGSLAELLGKKKKKKETGKEEEEDAMIQINPDEILHRNRACYAGWGPKLMKECLCYTSAGKLSAKVLARTAKDKLLQIFEFSLDIKVTGDSLDKAKITGGDLNKLKVFNKLKEIYEEKGKRCDNLTTHITNNTLDWAKHGHYSVETAMVEGMVASVTVLNKQIKQYQTMAPSLYEGDEGPFDTIEDNYSQFQAALVTPRDSYKLQFLFPSLGKSLKRKLSDAGCVDGLPASPAKLVCTPIKGDSGGTGAGPAEEAPGPLDGDPDGALKGQGEASAKEEDELGEPPSPAE